MLEQRRLGRGTRARPRRRVLGAVLASVAAVGILAGCAVPSADARDRLGRVAEQRDRVAEQAHERAMTRFAQAVRAKWGPVSLPEVRIVRWVDYAEWGGLMAECLADAGFPGARAADSGERIDFSGVDVDSARELFDVDVATFDCQGRYPVRSWFAESVRAIEVPWAFDYATSALPACLARHGWAVAPPPTEEGFASGWRTPERYDPYALVGPDPLERAAAASRCPSPEALLDGAGS